MYTKMIRSAQVTSLRIFAALAIVGVSPVLASEYVSLITPTTNIARVAVSETAVRFVGTSEEQTATVLKKLNSITYLELVSVQCSTSVLSEVQRHKKTIRTLVIRMGDARLPYEFAESLAQLQSLESLELQATVDVPSMLVGAYSRSVESLKVFRTTCWNLFRVLRFPRLSLLVACAEPDSTVVTPSDVDWTAIAPEMRSLRLLFDNPSLNVLRSAASATSLSDLELRWRGSDPAVSVEAGTALRSLLGRLETASLTNAPFSATGLWNGIASSTTLTQLNVGGGGFSETWRNALAANKSIKRLAIGDAFSGSQFAELITQLNCEEYEFRQGAHLSFLESLSPEKRRKIRLCGGPLYFGSDRQLQYLFETLEPDELTLIPDIERKGVKDSEVLRALTRGLVAWTKLRRLDLSSGWREIGLRLDDVLAEDGAIVDLHVPTLECRQGANSFDSVKQLAKLESLSIGEVTRAEDWLTVCRLTNLKLLSISAVMPAAVQDEDARPRWEALEELHLNSAGIPTSVLAQMINQPDLKRLSIRCPSLDELLEIEATSAASAVVELRIHTAPASSSQVSLLLKLLPHMRRIVAPIDPADLGALRNLLNEQPALEVVDELPSITD